MKGFQSRKKYIDRRKMDTSERFGLLVIKMRLAAKDRLLNLIKDERGDVPGWVLVVLMTTGLVTAIWAIASPKLTAILRNSLDAMNGIR